MRRLGLLVVTVLVIVLGIGIGIVIGACSDSGDASVGADAPIDAAPSCSLVGVFKSVDLDMDAGGAQVDVLKVNDNGFFEIDYYAGGMVSGPYTVSGSMVTLTDQLGMPPSLSCTAADTWSFTFTAACSTVAFEPVGDVCFAHKAVLKPSSGWTLTRQ